MVPLPEKVYFTGEAAEVRARNLPALTLDRMAAQSVENPQEIVALAASLRRLDGPVSLRARLLEGRQYKRLVALQGRTGQVVRLLRMAHLPHWVWVVEMQDRSARRNGEPCVLAEWVFDSTAHDDLPRERLASTMSVSTDGAELAAGQPPEIWRATNNRRPWRSLITDTGLLARLDLSSSAATAPQRGSSGVAKR